MVAYGAIVRIMANNKVYYGEYTLKHWIDLILTENIVLPEYQRYFVWNKKQSQALVEALLDNQFVPPVTIGSYADNGKKMNLILDGQQRLTSLLLVYYGVFPQKDRYSVKTQDVKTANENDDKEDEEIDFINWDFNQLLKLIKNKELREQDEIREALITAGYEDMFSIGNTERFDNSYLGFSFIVPASEDSNEQQRFYSKVFRSINIEGKKLLPLESREALYYLNRDYRPLFSPDFAKQITVNEGKMDFVRYLAILSQYCKNGGADRIAYRYARNMESYYEKFIYSVVGREETEEFIKLSDKIGDLDQCNKRMQDLALSITEMKLEKSFDSIIELDLYMFGLIYFTIFCGKSVKVEAFKDLESKIQRKKLEFKGNSLHTKSPSALKYLRIRVGDSILIYQEYIA